VTLKIAILASHEGTTAQAVMDACASDNIHGHVAVVISNNREAAVLRRAELANVPRAHLSGKTHPDPAALDHAILRTCSDAQADVVVLAGYMKRLASKMLNAYTGRIINTHPALLPAYGGQGMYGDRVHAAVLAAAERRSGASVHLVTQNYDEGPLLAQIEVPVLPDDDVASLRSRVRKAERQALLQVLAGWSIDR
jgi:phosphoribosylglycinamide formyltransferase-1